MQDPRNEPRGPDRRRFLSRAATAGAWIAGHALLGGSLSPFAGEPGAESDSMTDAPRIRSLELLTATPLATMKGFYQGTLGLPVVAERAGRLTIGCGATELTFVAAPPDAGSPFYHFAFNIPENKILAARAWQKERTELIPPPERLRDPELPDDIVDFRHWNAHSVFFFDPAENVVEYIARHDLENGAPGGFAAADILYASEIAFVVDDVLATADELKRVVGVSQYRGGDEQFTAVGDEHGLLLVFRRGRVLSLASARSKVAGVHATVAHVRGPEPKSFGLGGFPYSITID